MVKGAAWEDLTQIHRCRYHRTVASSKEQGTDRMRVEVCVPRRAWPQPHITIAVWGPSGEPTTLEPSHPQDVNLPRNLRTAFTDLHYPSPCEWAARVQELLAKDESLIVEALRGRGGPQGAADRFGRNRSLTFDYAYYDLVPTRADDFAKPDLITRSGAFGKKTAHVAKSPRNRR
jgi:hypothetical protein